LAQLGVLVCADCICNGLEQAGRGAVMYQGMAAQVSCLSHHLSSKTLVLIITITIITIMMMMMMIMLASS